jgi:hypothetical protein
MLYHLFVFAILSGSKAFVLPFSYPVKRTACVLYPLTNIP